MTRLLLPSLWPDSSWGLFAVHGLYFSNLARLGQVVAREVNGSHCGCLFECAVVSYQHSYTSAHCPLPPSLSSTQVTTLLQTRPYGQLTDCKAECAYQNIKYGIPSETFTTPTILGNRTSLTTCSPITTNVPAANQELTEPTSFASGNGFCAPAYENFLVSAMVFGIISLSFGSLHCNLVLPPVLPPLYYAQPSLPNCALLFYLLT